MSYKKQIKCLENGKVYDSITECSKELGVSISNISRCIHSETGITQRGKYHFKFVGDDTVNRIRCVETGEEYRTLTECGRSNYCTPGTIFYCIRDRRPTRDGLHFEYI